jgi:hypothetical protein
MVNPDKIPDLNMYPEGSNNANPDPKMLYLLTLPHVKHRMGMIIFCVLAHCLK